jgi:hypothetical protein
MLGLGVPFYVGFIYMYLLSDDLESNWIVKEERKQRFKRTIMHFDANFDKYIH